MKYNVVKAEVLTVEVGKENAGSQYVKLLLQPKDIFDPKSHVVCMFVSKEIIPVYEKLCANLALFPEFNGAEEIVEGLPPFNFVDDRTKQLIQPVRTSMSVFVRVNSDGKLADDPRNLAIRTIKQLGKFVEVSTEAIAAPPSAAPIATEAAATPPI